MKVTLYDFQFSIARSLKSLYQQMGVSPANTKVSIAVGIGVSDELVLLLEGAHVAPLPR